MKIIEYAPQIKCTAFGVTDKKDANGIGDNIQVYDMNPV